MSSSKTLTKIFEEAVTAQKKPRKSSSSPSIKPSILGSKCLRKIFYSYNKIPEDFGFPPKASKIVKLGDYIGNMLFDVFDEAGIAVKYVNEDGSVNKTPDGKEDFEFRLSSPELDIKLAKIDMVSIIDGKLWINEFKSINTNGFTGLKSPKPDHLIQGVTYYYLFNKALREGKFKHIKELNGYEQAEGVRFLYYHKDTSDIQEFEVGESDALFTEIIQKIQKVKWFSSENTLPPKTPEYCYSCPWRTKCAKNAKS